MPVWLTISFFKFVSLILSALAILCDWAFEICDALSERFYRSADRCYTAEQRLRAWQRKRFTNPNERR
jgi:hypothetical protein